MKAAVCFEPNGQLDVVDVEQEGPRVGEARVKIMAAGVCHSDWHIMNGDWQVPLPMVLGHEAAGIVQEVGPGVSHVGPGHHVIFSFRPHCGRCFYCSIGRSVLCDGHPSARWVLLDGTHRITLDPLISRTYKLDEINEGFAAMRAGQVARGVVVFD